MVEWIVNSTVDWIWSVDATQFGLLSFNESFRRYFLEKRGIAIQPGMRPEDLFPEGSPFIARWKIFFNQALEEGSFSTEYEVYAGTNILGLSLNRLEREGRAVAISIFARDVTEEWRTRRQLIQDRREAIENQARQRLILDSIPQSVFWKDLQGGYLGCNAAFARVTGLVSPDNIVGKTDFDLPWNREDALTYRADDEAIILSREPRLHIQEEVQQADGTRIVAETSKLPLIDRDGQIYGVLGIYDDITVRCQAEEALSRSEKALRTLSAGNEALVRASDESDLLQRTVHAIVEVGDYSMACVGFAQQDNARSIQIMASHFDNPATLNPLVGFRWSWGDDEYGQSPSGRAVRTGQTQLNRSVNTDPQLKLWHQAYLQIGCVAVLALPLINVGEVLGVLSICSRDPQSFKDDEVHVLERLASDLSYGLKNLRVDAERRQSGEQLRRNLQETIGVIAATVESRDPYTAGHQRRVAQLSKAIAQEMGLPVEDVDGIGFGALIHDVGNMQVPAGILARPGKLSKAEFELIKAHPLIGFEILKDIHLPWPVAAYIHQHHERLDGSGYPQGLKGNEIALGARIIAIADVVEAMMSHRPYRPRLTLDDALTEIEEHRGQKYDPAAVDACLALWRTGRFSFVDEHGRPAPNDSHG